MLVCFAFGSYYLSNKLDLLVASKDFLNKNLWFLQNLIPFHIIHDQNILLYTNFADTYWQIECSSIYTLENLAVS
jgi:hypothetical protein